MTDINELFAKIDKDVPPLPVLRFTAEKGKGGLFDSKLGGIPYFPKSMEYPTGTDKDYKDKPLRLLAQLNFEQLPHIEDFPEKGILQIFLACENDAVYGFDYNKTEEQNIQNGFRIIYHENIITDTSLLMSEEDIPTNQFSNDEYDFPLYCECILKAHEPSNGYGTADDMRFEKALIEHYNKISDKKINASYQVDNELFDLIHSRNPESDAFIGGYPIFEQYDPREGIDSLSRYDRVLFELLSVDDEGADEYMVLWGDVGTGSFLIPRDKLKSCDFSDVFYNYDCG